MLEEIVDLRHVLWLFRLILHYATKFETLSTSMILFKFHDNKRGLTLDKRLISESVFKKKKIIIVVYVDFESY